MQTSLTPYIPEILCEKEHTPLTENQKNALTRILSGAKNPASKETMSLIEMTLGVSQYHPEIIQALGQITAQSFLLFLWEETMPDGCEMAIVLFQHRYWKLLERFPTLEPAILFRLLRKAHIIDLIDAGDMRSILVTMEDYFWLEPGSFARFIEQNREQII